MDKGLNNLYSFIKEFINIQCYEKEIKKKSLANPPRIQNHPKSATNAQLSTIFSKLPIIQDQIIKSIEQKVINDLQSSIKKQISALKNVVPQIQDSTKQVQFNKPYKTSQSQQQQSHQLSEEDEEADDQIFVCGGKLQLCKNVFNNIQAYAQHIKNYHKNKVPKESSHTIDGQIIVRVKPLHGSTRSKSQTLTQVPGIKNNQCLNFNTKIPIKLVS